MNWLSKLFGNKNQSRNDVDLDVDLFELLDACDIDPRWLLHKLEKIPSVQLQQVLVDVDAYIEANQNNTAIRDNTTLEDLKFLKKNITLRKGIRDVLQRRSIK